MSTVEINELAHAPVRQIEFRVDGARIPRARWVGLVGEFNNWDGSIHRLALQPDGWWSISLMLPAGEHRYLFLVDGFPFNDPDDDGRAPCEWGGAYSLRRIR